MRRIPVHFYKARLVIVQRVHVGAIHGVDREAAAARNVADDAIARDRRTAF